MNSHSSEKHPRNRRRGIALVAALAVLSLLLLLAATAGIERSARRARTASLLHQSLARQYAAQALDDALATLAGTAGHDRCGTSSAELLPLSTQPRWCVAMRAGEAPVLLVSGKPANTAAPAPVLMVGPGTVGDDPAAQVHVPEVPVTDNAGRRIGRMAWWVADQGLKRSLLPADGRADPALFPGRLPSNEPGDPWVLLRQQSPGVPTLPEDLRPLRNNPDTRRALSIASLLPAPGPRFHDFTPIASFVLANSEEGGLREDISALADPTFSPADYQRPPPESFARWMRMTVPLDQRLHVGDGIHPVITEFALRCGIAADNTMIKPGSVSNRMPVLLNYHVFIDLWNPWARTLAMGDDSPDIRVVIRGLPKLTLSTGNAVLPDPLELDLDCFYDLSPGQVQLLSSPKRDRDEDDSDPRYPDNDAAGTSNTGVWQAKVGEITLLNNAVPVTLTAAPHSVTVEFHDLADPPGSAPFLALELANYAGFSIQYGAGEPFARPAAVTGYYGMSRTAFDHGHWAFAYHARMRDEFDRGSQPLSGWLTRRDPREALSVLDAPSGGDDFSEVLPRPRDYTRAHLIPSSDFFASRYSKPWWDRQAVLFDVPASEPSTLAGLADAPIPGAGPHSIGAGRDVADLVLDRYFLSTLPATPWDTSAPLRNHRLRPVDRDTRPTRSPGDAGQLLLDGGFNVNNASPEAWAALLRSLSIDDWRMRSPGGDEWMLDLTAPIFTQPYSAALPASEDAAEAQAEANTSKLEGFSRTPASWRTHDAFLIGLRDLGAIRHNGEPALDALARAIAARVRAHGRPFTSLSEFARSHVVQDAIDSIPGINLRENGVDAIPEGSPAHISQARILTALAPLLFARSDSFLIRTHGESSNPAGQVRARAWLEVLVQRMPGPVDPARPDERPFRIVYKRWLRDNEK